MNTTVVDAPPVAQTPATQTKSSSFTHDVMVEKYVALRDKVAEIKKRHTDELSKYNVAMAALEGWMLEALNTTGSDSIKTANGTFYKSTRTSVTCPRWSLTLEWIQENEAWDLLEARVNKTAAQAILAEKAAAAEALRAAGQPVDPASLVIPGVEIVRDTSLNVRRA